MNANFKTIIMQSYANFCQVGLNTSGLGSIQWKMTPFRMTNLFDYLQCLGQLHGPIFIGILEEILVWIEFWLCWWLSIMGCSFVLPRCLFVLNCLARFFCFLFCIPLIIFFRLNRETTKNYKSFQMLYNTHTTYTELLCCSDLLKHSLDVVQYRKYRVPIPDGWPGLFLISVSIWPSSIDLLERSQSSRSEFSPLNLVNHIKRVLSAVVPIFLNGIYTFYSSFSFLFFFFWSFCK